MFFIVNKTKGTIVLSDIDITLGPRQAIDLDKMMSRSKSDDSKMLKKASRDGNIDVRIKDGGKKLSAAPVQQAGHDLDDFKKEMLEEMKGLLSNQQSAPQAGLGRADLEHFAQQIISSIPHQGTVVHAQDARTDEDVEIDEEKLANINARTVDKIVEGTDLNAVNYKEEKQENTILDNISQLEDLIG